MIYSLGWALVHFVWQGTAIACALALVLTLARSARVRYAFACAAMASMVVAFVATLMVFCPGHSDVSPAQAWMQPSGLAGSGQGILAIEWTAQLESALPWVVPLWFACAAVLGVYRLIGWFAVQRLRQAGVCVVGAAWQHRFAYLRQRVGVSRPVTLLASGLAAVPVVVGFVKPAILLPASLITAMPAGQLEAILLHELAHIRRADYLINLLQMVVESVLFYHPAVWWTSGVIRAEREHACDDLVVELQGDPHTYACALLSLEHQRATAHQPALAASGGDLLLRIRRLLKQRESNATAASFVPALAVALAGFGALAFAWQDTSKATPFDKWLNEDVVYIVKPEERAAFTRLCTDEERTHFIEQFWQRRDPTPNSPPNEFKEEHYWRIAYANKRFGTQSRTGWTTDRGRIYILYGPPDEIESHPRDGFERWLYHDSKGLGKNMMMDFRDANKSGDYRLSGPPKPIQLKK